MEQTGGGQGYHRGNPGPGCEALGQTVLDMGAGGVLIKCGAPGIYYRTASGKRIEDLCRKLNLSMESWKDKEGFEPSFEPDAVVSGTGAGDAA